LLIHDVLFILALLAAVIHGVTGTAHAVIARVQRGRPEGTCPTCGYDRRSRGDRPCPECGARQSTARTIPLCRRFLSPTRQTQTTCSCGGR
jgi:tRNA(Ile2) C34 agmatinyltransferase TiaS